MNPDCYECVLKKLIQARAWEIYEWRMEFGEGGSSLDDWFSAEIEVLNRFAQDVVNKTSKDIQQENDNKRNGKGKTP